jgi:hypothetical protein
MTISPTNSLFDHEEGAQAPSDNANFKRMMDMAKEIAETEAQIEAMEETLKDLKGRNNRMKTLDLPDMMAEYGMTAIKLESGQTVEVSDFVQGSLPKDLERRKAAIDWLAANGAVDLIKNEVSVEFTKTQHNLAKATAQKLREDGLNVIEQETVHPQSLLAFAREKMRNGEEIPLEQIGLFSGRTVKIKTSKANK